MTGDELLAVENLVKDFSLRQDFLRRGRKALRAVDDVSFTLRKGEILSLVGESGCGKSTTARLALRLLDPTSGRITFGGRDISRLTRKEMFPLRRKMQIVFQDPYSSLNPRMRVRNILAEPLRTHGLCDRRNAGAKAEELLALVGLPGSFLDRYPHEFSGGQRQRIGIARALALEPELIVCDEPISALDVSIQAQIVNLLKDLQERMGLSYLFITHDLRVVRQISTNVAVMYLGRVVERGPVEAVFSGRAHPYTQALFSAIPVPDPSRRRERILLRGDVPSPLRPPSGCAFRTRCPRAEAQCAEEKPVLRQIGDGHFCACHCSGAAAAC